MPELRRRSPLEGARTDGRHGARPPVTPGVAIVERRGLALMQVLARPGQEDAVAASLGVDPRPGLASETPSGTALWLAPGTWMLVAEEVEDGGLYRSLREDLSDLAAIVDQSHGRGVLRLAGPRARDVLAKGCRLDLHPRVFTPGMCAQCVIAQIGVLLNQCDDIPTYDLYVLAGYVVDFLEWLTSSAAEFGYRINTPDPYLTA